MRSFRPTLRAALSRRGRRSLLVSAVVLSFAAILPTAARADVSLGGWLAQSPDDITGTTTLAGNDSTIDVALPFGFTIGGTNYSSVTISTNGWLEFGGNTSGNSDPTNDCLPSSAHTNPLLAAYWDDLNPFGTQVRYRTQGSSPNRVFLVDYETDINTGEGSDDLRFQVQLHERSNLITVRYRESQAQANGQGATVGFQGAGGAAAQAHSIGCNAKVLDDNRPDEGWSADVGRAGRVILASNTQHSPDDLAGFTTVSGNDTTANVTLPFSVSIDGTNYNNLTLSTNGWVEFGGNTAGNSDPTDDCLPTAAHTNPFLAVYWDDMMTFGTNIRHTTVGSAGGRVFIADFSIETAAGGGAENDVRAQVMVHEGSSLISVRYRDIGSGVLGNAAVIGFQGAGGSASAARPLTCNGRIIDDNDSQREGWSVDPRAASEIAVHGVMSHSPDDITGFTTLSGADNVVNVTLPFSVVIDGTSYGSVAVSTNGWLEFGGNTSGNSDPTNDCLPTSAHTNPFLAAFWDDLTPEDTNVRYGTVGNAPNRTFIVDAVSFITPSPDSANDAIHYQVQVHEGSNTIDTKYRLSQVQAQGQTATIGFQRAGGGSAVAHPISCNAPVLDDNRTDAGWSVTALPVCGNGLQEAAGGEVCDQGAANGTATSCCTVSCGLRSAGAVCRVGGGAPCDLDEACTGASAICPGDDAPSNVGITCRLGSGDLCDPDEVCDGTPGLGCPANDVEDSATVCRAGSGDVCDPSETCTGVAGQPCPANVLGGPSTICRTGSGDACDQAETCSGVPTAPCPGDDAPLNAGVVCRSGSGDVCDTNETCSGISGVQCPVDDAPGKLGTVCRLSPVGDMCDGNETCLGVAGSTCPPDDAPSKVNQLCRAGSGDGCDPDERCTGVSGQGCPQDVVADPTTVCRAGSGDVCDPSETCTAVPGAPCPADVVSPAGTSCRGAAGTCDVAETCSGTVGEACPTDAFQPVETPCDDDGDECTIDECNASGQCTLVDSLAVCGDGVPDGACGEACDDGNVDPGDGCSPTCQIELELVCPPTPYAGCKRPILPGRASLLLKKGPTSARDIFKWGWIAGERTTLDEFGTPLVSTDFQLCFYDATGLKLTALAPAGGTCAGKPCWKATGTSGFLYKDKELTPNGLMKLKLKAGAEGRAQIGLQGRGAALGLPSLGSLTQPFTVQIHNGSECWDAVYSAPATKSTAALFKDQGD